jgi:CheY-like chemotaxis protein
VITAADGQESVDVFNKHYAQVDLIIMDVVMPILTGPEAYTRMCAVRPDLRVIFTTGYTPKTKDLVAMLEKGASILRKPYSLISLSQLIRGTLEQKVPVEVL